MRIKLKDDVVIDGSLSFIAHTEYEVYSNGNSEDVNREFIISDINGKVISLFSLHVGYIRIWKD